MIVSLSFAFAVLPNRFFLFFDKFIVDNPVRLVNPNGCRGLELNVPAAYNGGAEQAAFSARTAIIENIILNWRRCQWTRYRVCWIF